MALKLDNSIQVLVGITDFYNKEMNPYELLSKSNLNIGDLSNYLIKTGKRIEMITKEEVAQFLI